jgi:hypothetical protein
MTGLWLDLARGIFIGLIAGGVLLCIYRLKEKREQEKERKAMKELVNSAAQYRHAAEDKHEA